MAVPESRLSDAIAARLPERPAPPPWATVLQAVVWWHRATPAALAQLPEDWRDRPHLPVTLGAFVRYEDTPVGPYSEVLASPVTLLTPRPAGHVPFIAVDSLASILGGRENWALPKTLADFAWERGRVRGAGEGWSVEAAVRVRPRALPFATIAHDRQRSTDGRELDIAIRARGTARLGAVDVRAAGPTLPAWLAAGRHPAAVIGDGRFSFAAARPAGRPGRR